MSAEILYAPWRMKYVTSPKKETDGCVFCAVVNDNVERDRDNYLLYRGKTAFALMNIYPYNTGHLLILPYQHVSTPTETSRSTQIEMSLLTTYFVELLSELMQPDGFNIGTNIGQAAGAGIADHLHTHIVPRWIADNNYISVVGNTRVVPELLDDTYDKIMALLQDQPPEISVL